MKKLFNITMLATLTFGTAAQATDVLYKKNSSLYVITDIDSGNASTGQDIKIDTAVGKYASENGDVLYLKGTTLYLKRNYLNDTSPEIIDRAVGNLSLEDGVIAYTKGSTLYVRRISDNVNRSSRKVDSGVQSFQTKSGEVVYIKNSVTLYRVKDLSRDGQVERLRYPVGEIQVSE